MSLSIFKYKFPVQWEILSLWNIVMEHEEAGKKNNWKKNPRVKFTPCCAVVLEFWDQPLAGAEDRTKPCEKSLFPLHFPRQKSICLLGKHKVWVIALCRITWQKRSRSMWAQVKSLNSQPWKADVHLPPHIITVSTDLFHVPKRYRIIGYRLFILPGPWWMSSTEKSLLLTLSSPTHCHARA